MFIYPVLDQKYHFCVNLVQKSEIVCLRWNLVPKLIQIYWSRSWRFFSPFWTTNTLFGKIWFKKSKLFMIKFDNNINLITLNSIVKLFFFGLQIPILTRYTQNFLLKINFGTSINSNVLDSVATLFCTALCWKYPFWANFRKLALIV